MRSSIRSRLGVAVCAVLAAGLGGCGGGSKQDAHKVLNQTFSGNQSIKSGKLRAQLMVDAKGISGLNGPVTLTLTGPFQSQGDKLPKFDLDLKLGAGGNAFRAGAVSTGDRGVIKFQGSNYALPPNVFAGFKQGFEQASAQRRSSGRNPSLSSLGIDPRKWLKDPKNEGDEDVAGERTVHVSSGVDVPKLIDDVSRGLQQAGRLGAGGSRRLPTNLSDEQKKKFAEAIKDPRLDVYSGKEDKLLRKLTIAFAFDVPKAQEQRANGLQSGKVTFDIELAGVNQPQSVQAPGNLKPFRELQSALGNLAGLGALLSPGGTTTPPGASGSTGSAGAGQSFSQCVTEAGGDPSKAQACTKLLPGR